MQRYFIENKYFNENLIRITDKDFHHIKNVMRKKIDEEIIVCNYQNQAFKTRILEFHKNEVIVEILEELEVKRNTLNLTLAQALIRKDNFELVLQKTTELGVKSIIPLMTERSIIKVNDEAKKQARYTLIVKEASEQSERTSIPTIEPISTVKALAFDAFDLVIVAYARETEDNKLSAVLRNLDSMKHILVIVGPEGGFTEDELNFLKDKATFVSLGKTILRSETAGIYMTSAIRYQWEN